ncbi:hypothetical protein GQ44DRAFT_727457 [Phaeosphaeriaceae sp. PMI808]|nr:hypothetical protein GQ44DRAFT_727457 [Phaeosphaeriaceae sp. PMI808]
MFAHLTLPPTPNISSHLQSYNDLIRKLECCIANEETDLTHVPRAHPAHAKFEQKKQLYASAQRRLDFILSRTEKLVDLQVHFPNKIRSEAMRCAYAEIHLDLQCLGETVKDLKDLVVDERDERAFNVQTSIAE